MDSEIRNLSDAIRPITRTSHPSIHIPTETSQVRTFLSTTPSLLRKEGEIERKGNLFMPEHEDPIGFPPQLTQHPN